MLAERLRDVAPDALVEVVDHHVRSELGGLRADVLLADYRIAGLWPVLRPDDPTQGLLAEQNIAARCYARQEHRVEDVPETPGVRLYVPLTVWGERLGILVADFPAAPSDATVRHCRAAADELAVALRAADRDTDRYRLTRRRQRLSMAAEMQWELLPGRCVSDHGYVLAGQLEPAYRTSGDNFDWAVNEGRLTVTVVNGHGTGLAASALTSLAVNAMRNARRSGGTLVEQAELASDTVFAAHRGARPVDVLLLEYDGGTGRVRAIDTGSPKAWRVRGSAVAPVVLDQQLPLGMFEETRYGVQTFDLAAGDRLFVVSDGVHDAAPGGGPTYGEQRLVAAIRSARVHPPAQAISAVMLALRAYHGDIELEDDAVMVCLDRKHPVDGTEGTVDHIGRRRMVEAASG
ncbi:Serine phosphatase RsbU, regulator of sigma subunit [Asanoa hainanensis]|uniref:Serine phosphatase RsbU, regulator of sigma subunit n=1 Tax=Asanoa hainanensis TaxID=560556 RepID=A0A239L5R2_9ACTN|nr:PP2C family protein-serine/threonine phosphatase [Asanoa hainanensis]SNT25967.1 Serine phosphatase RsbU, regulator of sigma subunit [Asanoa hainanensis]